MQTKKDCFVNKGQELVHRNLKVLFGPGRDLSIGNKRNKRSRVTMDYKLNSKFRMKDVSYYYYKHGCEREQTLRIHRDSKKISDLRVENLNPESWTMKFVAHNLRYLRSLSRLTIDFTVLMITGASKLAKICKTSHSLTRLTIIFPQISKHAMQILSLPFKHLNKLNELNVTFFDENMMEQFCRCLSNLDSLSSLKIKCDLLNDKCIQYLAAKLRCLTALTHISLNLGLRKSGAGRTKSYDMKLQVLSNALEHLTTLSHLSLNLAGWKISDTGLINFSKKLEHLTKMSELNLNFDTCDQITDTGLVALSKSLETMVSLTSLICSFENCKKIKEEGRRYLSASLNTMKSLSHLSLQFSDCQQGSEEWIEYFFTGLKSLVSLSSLKLRFYFCDQLRDEGINILSLSLQNLSSLTDINLDFTSCRNITQEGMSSLCLGLKHLDRLSKLTLDFGKCSGIRGIDFLVALKDLPSLSGLAVDLGSSSSSSDEIYALLLNLKPLKLSSLRICGDFDYKYSIKHLFQSLENWENLSKLVLDFKHFNSEDLITLFADLKHLRQLTNLKLDFSGAGIYKDGVQNLLMSLRHLKVLTDLDLCFRSGIHYFPNFFDWELRHLNYLFLYELTETEGEDWAA